MSKGFRSIPAPGVAAKAFVIAAALGVVFPADAIRAPVETAIFGYALAPEPAGSHQDRTMADDDEAYSMKP